MTWFTCRETRERLQRIEDKLDRALRLPRELDDLRQQLQHARTRLTAAEAGAIPPEPASPEPKGA